MPTITERIEAIFRADVRTDCFVAFFMYEDPPSDKIKRYK